jgi:superfamily I DNA/RNA helicase
VLRLDELNPPQREAVITVDGPLLVLAGAGSGKTRVITYRIGHLLDLGVAADEILAVSFTNKAADEMRQRVDKLAGKRARRCTLATFHALSLQILKQEKAALGFPSGFTIYDASDQLGTVKEILRQLYAGDDDRRYDAKAILFRISRAKNAFLTPEQYAEQFSDEDHEYDVTAAAVYPLYQEALKSFHALDFDDLICECVRLLDRDDEVRARWQTRFRYVMVDEYQDTNRAQFHLLNHLVRAHGNVCVVGDDDQSIYGWRGAEAGHILEFEHHFPGAKIVKLEENYRSTPHILDAANAVISNNKKRHDKRLWTARPARDKLQLVVCDDAEGEAELVAGEIELLCATRGFRARDCAVLYRSNVQARPLEEALRARSLQYKVVGGQAFFERKEVKDAIAYLKLALAPRDEISLRRIINYPARGIGATTLERIAEVARTRGVPLYDACQKAHELAAADLPDPSDGAESGVPRSGINDRAQRVLTSFCDLVENGRALLASAQAGLHAGGLKEAARAYLAAAGLQDELQAAAPTPLAAQKKLDNLEGFLTSLQRFEEREGRDLAAFLQRLTLDTRDDDDGADGADQVTLVTLHGAKGLEFPVVFLVGLEEELLPHKRTLYPDGPDVLDANVDLGEERRLLYVGITRARAFVPDASAHALVARLGAAARGQPLPRRDPARALRHARGGRAVGGGHSRGRGGVRTGSAGQDAQVDPVAMQRALVAVALLAAAATHGDDAIALHDLDKSHGQWQEGVAIVPAPWQTVQSWLTDYVHWADRFPDIEWAQPLGDDARGRHVVRFRSRLAGRTFVIHEAVGPHLLVFEGDAPNVHAQGRIWILDDGDGRARVLMQSTAKVHGFIGLFATQGYKRRSAFAATRSHLRALLDLAHAR